MARTASSYSGYDIWVGALFLSALALLLTCTGGICHGLLRPTAHWSAEQILTLGQSLLFWSGVCTCLVKWVLVLDSPVKQWSAALVLLPWLTVMNLLRVRPLAAPLFEHYAADFVLFGVGGTTFLASVVLVWIHSPQLNGSRRMAVAAKG